MLNPIPVGLSVLSTASLAEACWH